MAVPHMRDSHLDYQQEAAAPRHKEAQGCALRHNRVCRDASVALAPAVAAEDFVKSPLSQFLNILYNGEYLIGLISGTTQFQKCYSHIACNAEYHI